MKLTIFIYGLFDRANRCLYVGQTQDLEHRFRIHRARKGKFYRIKCHIRSLRVTDQFNASRIERQIGLAYKRRGEACYSKSWSKTAIIKREVRRVYVEGFHEPFLSIWEAARAIGVRPNTIRKRMEHYVCVMDNNNEVFTRAISREPIPYHFDFVI